MNNEPRMTAYKIIYELMKRKSHTLHASRDRDMYFEYLNNVFVQEAVKDLADAFELIVRRYGEEIYLIPCPGNTFLGFNRTEIRNRICTSNATSVECDLALFIILLLFAEIYDGRGRTVKGHDFITMTQFKNLVSERLKEGISNIPKEDETLYGINYHDMYDRWESLKACEEGQKMTKTTKDGFITSIIRFLKDQNLMEYIEADDQIRPLPKADVFMEQDILDKRNFTRVQSLIQEFERRT